MKHLILKVAQHQDVDILFIKTSLQHASVELQECVGGTNQLLTGMCKL